MIIIQNFKIKLHNENRLDFDGTQLTAEDKDKMSTIVWYMNSPYRIGPSIIRKTKKYISVEWRFE